MEGGWCTGYSLSLRININYRQQVVIFSNVLFPGLKFSQVTKPYIVPYSIHSLHFAKTGILDAKQFFPIFFVRVRSFVAERFSMQVRISFFH